MTIPPNDARDFFRIIQAIDVYFTTKLHMIKDASLEEINRQRSAGFASPEHLQGYVKDNPDKLGAKDLETVRSWADHVVEGRFLIHKERKDGCLFAHTDSKAKQPPVYMVKGLTQPISELVPSLPCFANTCFANTRLLPFRGHIVTDGIIAPQIQTLRQQSPELNLQYLLHMGRLNSKPLKASLKAKGITGSAGMCGQI